MSSLYKKDLRVRNYNKLAPTVSYLNTRIMRASSTTRSGCGRARFNLPRSSNALRRKPHRVCAVDITKDLTDRQLVR